MFELLDIWDFWLVTVWLSDLRSNNLASLLGWGWVPSCCGSRFRNWGNPPLRPSLSEMLRPGSLLVLGFSMAHFPNLQGILTSVGNFVDLAGHFTNAPWGVPCVRDLFLPKYRTRITSPRGWQVYESFPSINCDRFPVKNWSFSVCKISIQFSTETHTIFQNNNLVDCPCSLSPPSGNLSLIRLRCGQCNACCNTSDS